MIAALVLTPWVISAGWLTSMPPSAGPLYSQVVVLIVTVVGAGVLAVVRRDPEGTFRDMGATLLMIFYLGFLGSFAVSIRCNQAGPGAEGAWLLMVVILVTKASDIGGFFVGTAFGRHKLRPAVSPAKSVEGMAGGLVASALAAAIMALAMEGSSSVIAHDGGFPLACRAAVFGLALSAAGQLGDLVESCFKRDAGLKDSGKVIPCFGGILDLIDSPVLAMPVAWFLLTWA
jgi:phosphatidate cytidylyltransferase